MTLNLLGLHPSIQLTHLSSLNDSSGRLFLLGLTVVQIRIDFRLNQLLLFFSLGKSWAQGGDDACSLLQGARGQVRVVVY